MRIAGVELPAGKHVRWGLTSVKGIGLTTATRICDALSIPYDTKVHALSSEQQQSIRDYITSQSIMIEGDLVRYVKTCIGRLKSIGCWRGFRLRLGLPLKGRTHSNGKTAKRHRSRDGRRD